MPNPSTRNALEVPRQSLMAYAVGATTLAAALLTVAVVTGLPTAIFLLVVVYVVLLGGAVLVARRSGPGGVRRLVSGLTHWRIGWRNWAIAVAAIPVATIGVAILTGGYAPPPDGWLKVGTQYLFQTFVFGALFINLAEETAWNGLVQRNLSRRYGVVKAAGLTAIPFGAVHIPLSFGPGVSLTDALVGLAVTLGVAPFMRYAIGRTDHVTGGSLLAVGVLHAGFNASGNLTVVEGWWEHAVALLLVAVVMLVADSVTARSGDRRLYEVDAAGPHDVALSR